MGASVAVLAFTSFGANLSLRSFARIGSSLSLFGLLRIGSSMAVLDSVHMGSSLALRSFSLFGSSLSVFGDIRLGSSVSVFDFSSIGSSLSLRSFSRLGSAMSISGNLHLGGDIKGLDTIYGQNTTMSDGILDRRLSLPPTGDFQLHGVWVEDQGIVTSDRRLKLNIEPLAKRLQKHREEVRSSSNVFQKVKGESAVEWVLRELRPVSFRFKVPADSKALPTERFGFVAQEVEKVAPNLVRGDDGAAASETDGQVSFMYKDLLAMLTLALQEQRKHMNRQQEDVLQAQLEVTELLDAADQLETLLNQIEAVTEDADLRS